jgi:hypothetical protein
VLTHDYVLPYYRGILGGQIVSFECLVNENNDPDLIYEKCESWKKNWWGKWYCPSWDWITEEGAGFADPEGFLQASCNGAAVDVESLGEDEIGDGDRKLTYYSPAGFYWVMIPLNIGCGAKGCSGDEENVVEFGI